MSKPPVRRQFDESFFQRFYLRPAARAARADEVARLARFVLSYLDYIGIEVKTVLDAGCGIGLWRGALRRVDRDIAYTGIDTSEYLCEKFGWTRSSIGGFRSRRKYDLVVCQDVLQYLDETEARNSIDAIARLCRGACFVNVPTKEDFADATLDLRQTDRSIYVRGVSWYRRCLGRHFTSAGGGVYVPNRLRTILLALERG